MNCVSKNEELCIKHDGFCRVVEKRPDVYPALPVSRSGWWESKDLKLQTAADVAEHVCMRTEFQVRLYGFYIVLRVFCD